MNFDDNNNDHANMMNDNNKDDDNNNNSNSNNYNNKHNSTMDILYRGCLKCCLQGQHGANESQGDDSCSI